MIEQAQSIYSAGYKLSALSGNYITQLVFVEELLEFLKSLSPLPLACAQCAGMSFEKISNLSFYLSHMQYEGSNGLVSGKMRIFFCRFSRFMTFYC
jgi:hypothetical protein